MNGRKERRKINERKSKEMRRRQLKKETNKNG